MSGLEPLEIILAVSVATKIPATTLVIRYETLRRYYNKDVLLGRMYASFMNTYRGETDVSDKRDSGESPVRASEYRS